MVDWVCIVCILFFLYLSELPLFFCLCRPLCFPACVSVSLLCLCVTNRKRLRVNHQLGFVCTLQHASCAFDRVPLLHNNVICKLNKGAVLLLWYMQTAQCAHIIHRPTHVHKMHACIKCFYMTVIKVRVFAVIAVISVVIRRRWLAIPVHSVALYVSNWHEFVTFKNNYIVPLKPDL